MGDRFERLDRVPMMKRAAFPMLLISGCAAFGVTSALGAPPDKGTLPVATFHVMFIDRSRPTAATETTPESPDRMLETTIAYPLRTKGRVPLIVLAHGDNGNPSKFSRLIAEWSSAGYVVAAPAFPLTRDDAPGPSVPADLANQPVDLEFVLDQVLKLDHDAKSPLAGLVDARHIGAAGLSLGGATIYALISNTCCIDKRIDAAVLMAAGRSPFEGGTDKFRPIPTLLLHGDADPLYPVSRDTFPLLKGPKWFVTLKGSKHATPFEDSADPADAAVPQITVAFWDRYLKGEKAAQKRLEDAVAAYPQAELQRSP
jgi:predicted dienelactone hydrolase